MKFWLPALVAVAAVCGAATQETAVPPFENLAEFIPHGKIDQLVAEKWRDLGIRPAFPSSDAVFLRRVYLDVIGTLPTAAEASAFLADTSADKRRALIDHLLQRPEFDDYWGMKWSDLLRVKAEFPINLWPNAAQGYHHWIVQSIRENKPADKFARELLTASGSNFRVPQVNFYRAMQSRDPQTIARIVALTFMGQRAEKWPMERLASTAAFFSQVAFKDTREWKEEIVFSDARKQRPPGPFTFPDGSQVRIAPDQDPRAVFASWLTAQQNPWFAKTVVNRAWYWLLGRGIVHEPDDMRPDNPPENAALLDYLAAELISSHYDLKHVFRLILNSSVYQLSSIPRSDRPDAARHFAYYPLRRLDAEVLIDALCQVTGTTESYTSAIPEPYTVMPEGQRAIGLPDGSIGSPFLELFGRPPRDTGLESERNNRPSDAQRLHLLNSTHVRRKIEQSPALQQLIRSGKDPITLVNEIYLALLSRPPTDDEWRAIAKHSSTAKGRTAVNDLVWALINTAEFAYRH